MNTVTFDEKRNQLFKKNITIICILISSVFINYLQIGNIFPLKLLLIQQF